MRTSTNYTSNLDSQLCRTKPSGASFPLRYFGSAVILRIREFKSMTCFAPLPSHCCSRADLAHAYHLLIEKGVPAENIVTMMYDDVALDPRNPNPGELRNVWNGPDYRKGLKVDY
ncbi:hypothetical protein ANCDUO_14491, partial [Ancylostoma duodenale]